MATRASGRGKGSNRVKGSSAKAGAGKGTGKKRAAQKSPAKKAPVAKKAPAKKAPAKKPARGGKKGADRSVGAAAGASGSMHPFYQVDAFTGRLFRGNPAGVVLLEKWLSADRMQSIAAENNLAETAFVIPGRAAGGVMRLGIRWFTPEVEMDLCGHATLAAAHVLWEHVGLESPSFVFDSQSGALPVERENGLIALDFPSRPAERSGGAAALALARALGREPVEVYRSRDILAVFENRRDVYEMTPDFEALRGFDALGVIVTAPGSGHDFVSRFFAPRAGVNEDPVTGSAHCTLVPYWSGRLGKKRLTAHQVSRRGGELLCEDRGPRVRIAGRAVTYLEGRIRS